MADYIYLLETRLSPAQRRAIEALRVLARENESTIFLTGGAVRDLTGGGSIRDLDLTLQGDALKLKKSLEKAGIEIAGENTAAHQLFLTFPGGVRIELGTAMAVSFPKPGKPKYEPSSIIDDLRSRDFTANAMAISLNEGSYGLLMDPLNGVADIENRELRLVSNYGFIEDPSRLIRASRLSARLGWQMEEKTQQRYETAKSEGYISALNPWNRSYELEEIFHEDEPVRALRFLEAEGWAEALFPGLSSTRANTTGLADLAERQGQLQMQGILSHHAALAFPLVTGKMAAGDVERLKASFARPGFVREIDSVDAKSKEFSSRFASKEAASPSAAWKLLHASEPDLVLAMSFGSKGASVQTRLKTFLTESPTARQRLPYQQMAEMRITPDLPIYDELLDKLFFELMDGKLSTPEEIKAYLEPFSPPAPPPPVNLRRARAKKEARPSRAKAKKTVAPADDAPVTAVPASGEPATPVDPKPEEVSAPVAPVEKATPAKAKKAAPTAAVPEVKAQASPEKPAVPVKSPADTKPTAPVKSAVAAKAPVEKPKAVAPAKQVAKSAVKTPASKSAPAKAAVKKQAAPAKVVKATKPAAKGASAKAVASPKKAAVKAVAAKAVAKKTAPPAKKPATKTVTKAAVKAVPAKKVAAKKAPAKATSSKATPPKKTAPARKAPAKAVKTAAKKVAAKKTSRR